jgi:hypothetical protein
MNTQASQTRAPATFRETRTGVVEHIVLFQWKEEARLEAINTALAELRKLKDKIPGIVDIYSGANFSDRAKGFTHALVVHFKDRPALQAYIPHPEHQRVVQNLVSPIRADTLVVDLEL